MASAAAAASGLRQHFSRPSPHFLLSSRLCHHCFHFSLLATSLFPSSTSRRPPLLVRPPISVSVVRPQRLLCAPASATSPATHPSPRRVVTLEEEDDGFEGAEAFDVAYDDGQPGEDGEDMEDGGGDGPEAHGQADGSEVEWPASQGQQQQLPRYPSPKLSVKEKEELASYAHSLGKKLKFQQVGKSGVTTSLTAAFIETLEANELLKLKVHGSCPGELPDVIKQLEESTGSVAVGRIGRSVILYRPSLSMMQKKDRESFKKTWKPNAKEQANELKLQKIRPVRRLSGRHSSNTATRI